MVLPSTSQEYNGRVDLPLNSASNGNTGTTDSVSASRAKPGLLKKQSSLFEHFLKKEKDRRSSSGRQQLSSSPVSDQNPPSSSTESTQLSATSTLIEKSSPPAEQERVCSTNTCTKRLPPQDDYPYRTCERCREKDKRKREKKRLKSAEERKASALGAVARNPLGISNPTVNSHSAPTVSSSAAGPVKRKNDDDDENGDSGASKKVKLDNLRNATDTNMYNAFTEYQSSRRLLRKVKNMPIRGHFKGRYSVVAGNEVDNKKRVQLVWNELRMKAGVLLDNSSKDVKYNNTRCRIASDCACAKKCGGKVRVRVMDDHSHSFLKGQRIVVEIRH